MKRTAIEALCIVLLALLIALIYNTVSPTGIKLLPKRTAHAAERAEGCGNEAPG